MSGADLIIDPVTFEATVNPKKLAAYQAALLDRTIKTLIQPPRRMVKSIIQRHRLFSIDPDFERWGSGLLFACGCQLYYLPHLWPDFPTSLSDCRRVASFPSPVTSIHISPSEIIIGTDKGNENVFGVFSGGSTRVNDHMGRPIKVLGFAQRQRRTVVCGRFKLSDIGGRDIVSPGALLGLGGNVSLIDSDRGLFVHTQSVGGKKAVNRVFAFDPRRKGLGKPMLRYDSPHRPQSSSAWTAHGFLSNAPGNALQLGTKILAESRQTRDIGYGPLTVLSDKGPSIWAVVAMQGKPELNLLYLTTNRADETIKSQSLIPDLDQEITAIGMVENRTIHQRLLNR